MAQHYHSGFQILNADRPFYRQNDFFVSEWRLDDITNGYALDSQHSNNLRASGSPTQVAGWKLSSGVQFDGIDDLFYLPWASGSGLEPLKESTETAGHIQFGFLANIFVDDFSTERTLVSRWNNVGSDMQFQVNIGSGRDIIFRERSNAGTSVVTFTSGGLIPSGEWCNFGFKYIGQGASAPYLAVQVNDTIFITNNGTSRIAASSSGVFHIGGNNFGRTPSGFFKGKMENAYFFNGLHWDLPQWNYWASGNFPISTRPKLNSYHPNLKGWWHLGGAYSGNDPKVKGPAWIIPDATSGNNNFIASGTARSGLLIQTEFPGEANGTKGSGQGYGGDAYHVIDGRLIFPTDRTLLPPGGFTVAFWARPNLADANNRGIVGGAANVAAGFPWTVNFINNQFSARMCTQDATFATPTIPAITSGTWAHFIVVWDFAKYAVYPYISGVGHGGTKGITGSGLWPNFIASATASLIRLGSTYNGNFSGILDEVVFFDYPFTSGEAVDFYNLQSGYLTEKIPSSSLLGGYINAIDARRASGMIGGYIIGPSGVNGLLGGFISGVPPQVSGMIGAWIRGTPNPSGFLGGYIAGQTSTQKFLGGFIHGRAFTSGAVGGWVAGVEAIPNDATFYAFFNIVGRDKKEFDAAVQVFKSLQAEFDATTTVFIRETRPDCLIIVPSTNQSGTTVPVTYQFEATASGYNGKRIAYTQWFFSDIPGTSGSVISSSGTYKTSHTFAKSGLFDVIFIAVDENGLVNSDRRIINTASGTTLPTITLTASPESGVAPLVVGFSGVINTAPYPIIDKFIYFGDNTFSASTRNIMKLYPVPGAYIPVFRVQDSRGIIVTDSILVGVND